MALRTRPLRLDRSIGRTVSDTNRTRHTARKARKIPGHHALPARSKSMTLSAQPGRLNEVGLHLLKTSDRTINSMIEHTAIAAETIPLKTYPPTLDREETNTMSVTPPTAPAKTAGVKTPMKTAATAANRTTRKVRHPERTHPGMT